MDIYFSVLFLIQRVARILQFFIALLMIFKTLTKLF